MSYGGSNRGNHAWSLSEEESRPFIPRALEAGINFFDTANRYSLGKSEDILGRATRDFARRDEVVIATKVYGRMRPGPNGAGLSRKAIFAEIDCMRRPIENNASPGQAVYEPFSGSGTTIIAAEMTGRVCHAIEIAPHDDNRG